ncbi:hypothetical protein EV663_12215 [Rhodovulum bhavnagarense]|uniref:Uncharacterized protein n=1 Tax=Rhodovulum bhavnagarense TaxID=992286 RepID=A0A4R2R9B0_9RHOB|nr:hypothetical protein [Rhodovulum bhavnagarense]TCP58539.1 hypothetical protein EV663_12215 [Rhodovulum bhavnagarense]
MSETPQNQIDARIGFFAGRVTCRLTDHHVEILNGVQVTRIAYGDIATIRIARQDGRRTILELQTTGGQTKQLRHVPPSGPEAAADFLRSLILHVAQVAPDTPLRLGPNRRQQVAAWIGVVASVAILLGAGWSLITGGTVVPLLLPIGIALVNLAVVIPILQAGRSRDCIVSEAPANLV